MDEATRKTFDASLLRCNTHPDFLDRFYERFLASSPKVQEKFANTDFERQKRLLRASFYMILLASEDEESGPDRHLAHIARRHSANELDIGADLYDLWLDALVATVRQCDPSFDDEVEQAWESMMAIGIRYLCRHYHSG